MTTITELAKGRRWFAVDSQYTDCPALIIEGESGYHPLTIQQYQDLRDQQTWSQAELDAAVRGSMFGWWVPAVTRILGDAE